MSAMPIDAIFAEVDTLPYPHRMRTFASRAQDLLPMVDTLRQGNGYERGVALFVAEVGRNTDLVTSFLDDPDWRLRQRAMVFLIRSGAIDASTLGRQLADAPAQLRQRVWRVLRSSSPVADALVDQIRETFGDAEAAALMPSCGPETVARLLPVLGHHLRNWAAVARRHPLVVLAEAERQLVNLPGPDRIAWWARHGDGILAAAQSQPLAVLDLLERLAPATQLPGDLRSYGVLAAADPVRVLALLTAPGRSAWLRRVRLPFAVLDRLRRLDPALLADLARGLRDNDAALVALLDVVAPSRRGELFDAAFAGVARDQAELSAPLLDVLPRERRWAEARWMLTLGTVRDTESRTLEVTAHLPWSEAEPVLTAATSRGEPDERARAWELLVSAAGRSDRAAVRTVLERMRRLRNEQEPVRSRALAALARLRPWLIEADMADALLQIASDALGARDSSSVTSLAISELAVAILRQHFDAPPLLAFAQQALQLVYGADRMPWIPPLDSRLRRGQEATFYSAVRAWLEAGVERGEYQPLLAITRALGRRAWGLTELQDLLEQAMRRANISSVVEQVISAWLDDPRQRSRRVEQVLRFDSSAIAVAPVWSAVSRRRTDLLDLVLSGPAPRGRFIALGVRWVPSYADTRRWLPRQVQSYVDMLAHVAGDAEAKVYERTAAIRAAAPAGGAGRALVERYVGSPDVTLAEAALGALAWTDRPDESLPLLLSYMDTDRARVAIYAAGRAAAFVAPSRLGELLTPVALGSAKITSRKEALRLLARFSVPGFAGTLLRVWRSPDQHRDVRAAVVSTARQRLDDPASWEILAEAATGDRYDARALVRAHPFEVAGPDRRRYGALIAQACTHPDREAARAAWEALPRWAEWAGDLDDLLVTCLGDLADRSLWGHAVQVIVELTRRGGGERELIAAIDTLLRLDAADPTADDPAIDRPAYRRLASLVESLIIATRWADPDADRRAIAEAGHRLAAITDRAHLGARLLAYALPIERFGEICDLLSGQPGADLVRIEVSERVDQQRPDPDVAFTTAASLAERGDLPGGLLALGLAGYGELLGWPAPWRNLVRGLRNHPVGEVRLAALDLSMEPD